MQALIPAFNAERISLSKVEEYEVFANYYTLKNNVDGIRKKNLKTKVNSTAIAFEQAVSLMPYFFVVSINGEAIAMIMLKQRYNGKTSFFVYMVVDMRTQTSFDLACKAKGIIAEYRAKELVENQYDPKAYIREVGERKKLHYQGQTFKVQSYQQVEEEVFEIVKTHEFFENFRYLADEKHSD
ncbi:hypothetical protein [Xanthovirga aplysinae]|uniref:hypothetical protein n=1 Tax=Xanthovirga aplysinae TaxID=2529853 RepID=UPI0012BC82D3|nr:hypothetical protein [Xanthovirga aplysinae]MTI30142.1 hypothetical protein [Xanthovirga aplysinae]